MSTICIAVLQDQKPINQRAKKELCDILQNKGLYCFFDLKYREPFLENIGKYQCVSISDDSEFDNCEMFLLPDRCFYNGKTNLLPFSNRMSVLEDVTSVLQKNEYQVEWFIGDSGTPFDEFQTLECLTCDLSKVISQNFFDFKTAVQKDIHIIVKG